MLGPLRRFLLLAVLVPLVASACSSGGSSASSSTGAIDSWNDQRAKQGSFQKAANQTALGVLDRLGAAGITCERRQTDPFALLVNSYQKLHLPLPAGSASCDGPGGENVLVEVFRTDGFPTGADFIARKRALVCARALELGKRPGAPNDFPGLPYLQAKDGSWVLEPDSFPVLNDLAKALDLKPRNACEGVKAQKS